MLKDGRVFFFLLGWAFLHKKFHIQSHHSRKCVCIVWNMHQRTFIISGIRLSKNILRNVRELQRSSNSE